MKTEVGAVILDTVPSQAPAFHMAIGRAMANWQFVEKALCEVFCNVSTCRDKMVAAAIFYTSRDFSEKLNITRSAARLSLSKENFTEFNAFRKRIITGSEYRNALAHFHVSNQMIVGESVRYEIRFISTEGELMGGSLASPLSPNSQLMLHPNASDPNQKFKDARVRPKTKKPMAIAAIVKLTQLFQGLASDLRKFAATIPPP
jgi:hypothetical protein